MRKPVFGVSDQVRLKLARSAIETCYSLECLDLASISIILSRTDQSAWMRRLICAFVVRRVFHDVAQILKESKSIVKIYDLLECNPKLFDHNAIFYWSSLFTLYQS